MGSGEPEAAFQGVTQGRLPGGRRALGTGLAQRRPARPRAASLLWVRAASSSSEDG